MVLPAVCRWAFDDRESCGVSKFWKSVRWSVLGLSPKVCVCWKYVGVQWSFYTGECDFPVFAYIGFCLLYSKWIAVLKFFPFCFWYSSCGRTWWIERLFLPAVTQDVSNVGDTILKKSKWSILWIISMGILLHHVKSQSFLSNWHGRTSSRVDVDVWEVLLSGFWKWNVFWYQNFLNFIYFGLKEVRIKSHICRRCDWLQVIWISKMWLLSILCENWAYVTTCCSLLNRQRIVSNLYAYSN